MASKTMYKIARKLIASICKKKDITYIYKFNKEEYLNKQVLIIADHAATDAYLYVMNGFLNDGLCPIIGENNAYNLGTKFLIDRIDSITKKLFLKDGVAARKILKALKDGRSILLFPEGIQSICGTTSPIIPSTIALLKKANLDIILAKTKGTYLANPRYNKYKYKGHTEVEYQILFTKDELLALSDKEILDKLYKEFKYNDFEWNYKNQYSYSGKTPVISDLSNIIYYCPKCESIGEMESKAESIKCKICNNEILMDDKYNIKPRTDKDYLPYEILDQWFDAERKLVRREVKKDEFEDKALVELYKFRKYLFGKAYKKVSEGSLFIDKNSITYTDSSKQEYSFNYSIKEIPSLPFNAQIAMQVYINDKLYILKPVANKSLTIKYIMEIQELHALVDPDWKDAYDRIEN